MKFEQPTKLAPDSALLGHEATEAMGFIEVVTGKLSMLARGVVDQDRAVVIACVDHILQRSSNTLRHLARLP